MLADGMTRITSVWLTQAVREARSRHQTSPMATVALGRAMAAGALLGSTVRESGSVNLQFVGNGPLGSLVVDASGGGTIRAYVRRPRVTLPMDATGRVSTGAAVGREGHLHVLVNSHGSKYSRGTCSLVSGEIDDDVEGYLVQSAQVTSALATDVVLAATGDTLELAQVAGLLVQVLPGGSDHHVKQAREKLRHGGMSALLAGGPPDALSLMASLFPDQAVRRLDEQPIRWQCRCSRQRVLSAIASLGVREVSTILKEDGKVDATCDFCRSQYRLTATDLEMLVTELEAQSHGGPEVA
jgi:molecular chaperone Hsp33